MLEPVRSRVHLSFCCPVCDRISDYIDSSKCVSNSSSMQCSGCGVIHKIRKIKSIRVHYDDFVEPKKLKKPKVYNVMQEKEGIIEALVDIGYSKRDANRRAESVLLTNKGKSKEQLFKLAVLLEK